MNTRLSFRTSFFCFLFTFCSFIATGAAESFPFRAVEPGSQLPDARVFDQKSGQELALGQLKGHPSVLAFWGGDIPTKKNRAIQALTELREMNTFFKEKGINFLVINAQGDSGDIIDEVSAAAGLEKSVYVDQDHHAYGVLGIFVMPSVMLVDQNGKVVNGFGYSKDMTDRLRGEIEIMQGEKTREQVEAELHPTMVEKSKEAKAATRHLNMGKVLAEKGQPDSAIREFQAAVENNPKLGEAYVALGCTYLQLGKLAEAQAALDKGYDLLPDSLDGEICNAQIKAEQGAIDDAIYDLQAMIFRNGRNHHLRYVLGTFYAKKNDHEKATAEFRKAYELLEKRNHFDQ